MRSLVPRLQKKHLAFASVSGTRISGKYTNVAVFPFASNHSGHAYTNKTVPHLVTETDSSFCKTSQLQKKEGSSHGWQVDEMTSRGLRVLRDVHVAMSAVCHNSHSKET
jgi:hypothetical protein